MDSLWRRRFQTLWHPLEKAQTEIVKLHLSVVTYFAAIYFCEFREYKNLAKYALEVSRNKAPAKISDSKSPVKKNVHSGDPF